jgi:hypothetical protein
MCEAKRMVSVKEGRRHGTMERHCASNVRRSGRKYWEELEWMENAPWGWEGTGTFRTGSVCAHTYGPKAQWGEVCRLTQT